MAVMALAGLKGDLSGRYYSLGDMTEKEQQQLIDVSLSPVFMQSRIKRLMHQVRDTQAASSQKQSLNKPKRAVRRRLCKEVQTEMKRGSSSYRLTTVTCGEISSSNICVQSL